LIQRIQLPRIVRQVEDLFALAGQIEARFPKAQRQAAALRPFLLDRVFKGEL